MSEIEREQPEIIESHQVVGVCMCEKHRINHPDIFSQQLGPQVGWRVDEKISIGQS
jgi:hypothetical protein